MITVIDYGAGNLASVRNALAEVNVEHTVVNTPAGVRAATDLILPGVGHFGQMMHALDVLGLRQPLLEQIAEGVPFFGICLGMQALFEGSEEAPGVKGLGLLPGLVRRFPAEARVPHMGWNRCEDRTGSGRGRPLPYRYFAHSYYCPVDQNVVCEVCAYGGVTFMASLQNATIQGVQYHPEKSGPDGVALLRGFASC
ncbi:MAG TPA: imidazole glycerol phosphate synthase subunit HisH [Bryobacteraceae bacterium]|nr:imidazole glycerol phosphate synthase subunit HisH [Bryobacteraceae bacterium]